VNFRKLWTTFLLPAAERKMRSGQPAEPALSEVEGMPAIRYLAVKSAKDAVFPM
jgi:hypothetical protein